MGIVILVVENQQSVVKNRLAGLEKAESRLVVMADDDIMAPPFWCSKMAAALDADESIGVVSAARVGLDMKPQRGFGPFPDNVLVGCTPPGTFFMYDKTRLNGCKFDERYKGALVEDTDFMYQVQSSGLKTVVNGSVVVIHEANKTNVEDDAHAANMKLFNSKWAGKQAASAGGRDG